MRFIHAANAAQNRSTRHVANGYKKRISKVTTENYEDDEGHDLEPYAADDTVPTGKASKLSMAVAVAEAVFDIHRLLQARVIGTAWSSAMPGKQFDINLSYFF